MKRPDVALAIHPGVHTEPMLILWKPTLQLLAKEQVPLAMTTYNQAEFEETLEVGCCAAWPSHVDCTTNSINSSIH